MLSQYKIIDLSRILAGPWATQLLADLGATVIKVEKPQSGDDTRHWGPPFVDNNGEQQAAYFQCANRNKLSITCDISQTDGQQIITELVKQADVLVENFKVGGLKKYGLDYQSLSAINPQLVYCSITGYGQTGCNKNKTGYDAMIQAESGLMSITGFDQPTKVGVAVTDIFTGLYAANAIQAALISRSQTGDGQHIDLALFDVQLACLANQAANFLSTQQAPQPLGNAHPNIVPYQSFKTLDGAIMLAVGNDSQFQKLCSLLQDKSIALDKRFATNAKRVQNRASLIALLQMEFKQQPTDYWLSQLEQFNIPCGRINSVAQAINSPQAKSRELVKQTGSQTFIANPIQFSQPITSDCTPAPKLGEHTEQVLNGWLGYDKQLIKQLQQKKVI